MSRTIDFKDLYNEYQPKILNYVSRLTGQYEAEDITQEVFQKVSRSLGEFKGKSQISTWIYRIATNTALDVMKSPSLSRSLKETVFEDGVAIEERDIWTGQKKIPIDQELIRKEMSKCVREHVDKLPPDYRAVILLSELEGFKNREIADILQVSLDTVKIRLHRARARLKKLLNKSCNFYHNEQAILACDRKPPLIPIKKTK